MSKFKYVIGARTIAHPNSYNKLEGIVTAESSGQAILLAIADQYFDPRRPLEEEAGAWGGDVFLEAHREECLLGSLGDEATNWCWEDGRNTFDVEVEEVDG